jgi:hypothetical protein
MKIQIYKTIIYCSFVWVWNLVCHVKGGIDWGCVGTKSWVQYMDLREMKWQDNMKTSPNIRVIKSKLMRWVGHVICMGWWKILNFRRIVWREETTQKTRVDGWIILKWILENHTRRVWIGFIWHRIWTGGWLLWTQ